MMHFIIFLLISILSIHHVSGNNTNQSSFDSYLFDKVYRVKDTLNSSSIYNAPPLSKSQVETVMDEYLMNNLASYQVSHPLLCVTFAEAHDEYLKILTSKLISLNGTCDWAVLVYRGSKEVGAVYEQELKDMDLYGNKIVLLYYDMDRLDMLDKYAVLSDDFFVDAQSLPDYDSSWDRRAMIAAMLSNHPFNRHFLPKPLLLANLLPIARQYDYVWMFDGDMSVDDFDVSRLYQNLHCAFEHPPMVAQPLVYENTQSYWYFNSKSWTNKVDVIAHETSFIEMQTPIFNGLFLEFFLSKVVSRILWSVHSLGVDIGFDNTFCPMATAFAQRRELALYKLHHNVSSIDDATQAMILSKKLTPCAVIVDGTPVHHHDDKIVSKIQSSAFRKHYSGKSRENFVLSFPGHYRVGEGYRDIDPYGKKSKLVESKELIKNCKVPYQISYDG